jgi:DNA-binding transcriptional ArsR family regulator
MPQVATVFQALADERRRAVLELLGDRELTATEIAGRFDVTRQAVSQHLRTLLDAGLVVERRSGTRRYYRVRPEGLDEARAFLDLFWSSRLDALRRAEREDGGA